MSEGEREREWVNEEERERALPVQSSDPDAYMVGSAGL